nr:hypothetical protein [Tanacetum cinerariifolium]
MSDQLAKEKNNVKIKQTKISDLEECLRKMDFEKEHLKFKVVDFTTVQNLQVQVEELKSVNESLNLSVEELYKAPALAEATLRERDEMISAQEYSQWVERFMNYLEEQTDEESMINSIKNSDQPLPCVTQVSFAGTSSTEQPHLKDKSMCNKTAKDLWDAFVRHMLGSEYGEQDRKATVLYEYETFKANEGYNILKQNQGDVNDAMGSKKKTVVVTSDPLSLIAEKTKVSKSKEKVVVSSNSEGSDVDDFSELKKITALLAKAFNRRKFYSKPTNNNLRTSSTSQSANKKQEFVKTDNKKVEKKDDEKKRDMSRVKYYNCKKEGHFVKDCKKVKHGLHGSN